MAHHYATRNECSKGHAYTPENTLYREQVTVAGTITRARVCRACKNQSVRDSYYRKKEERLRRVE